MTEVDVSNLSSEPAAAAVRTGIRQASARVRASVPLVQCITNTVVQQFSANVLLAAGASPAMLDHEADAAQFAALSNALLVNFGTATNHQLLAADAAVQTAAARNMPWVLDPVSLGAADHRSLHITRLSASSPTVIRGNASEIAGLAGTGAGGRGIESIDTVEDVLVPAAALAARTGAIAAVSGPVDAVVAAAGDRAVVARVAGGHRLMPLVVGTGCSLGALTAAYLGAVPAVGAEDAAGIGEASGTGRSAVAADAEQTAEAGLAAAFGAPLTADAAAQFAAVLAAHAHFAAAGTAAGERAHGPGTFLAEFVDALHAVTPEEIAGVDIRISSLPLPDSASARLQERPATV